MFPNLCTPTVDFAPHRHGFGMARNVAPFGYGVQPFAYSAPIGNRFGFGGYGGFGGFGNIFNSGRLYSAQNGVASGVGLGGLLGAVAGFAFASNPFTGLAMAATGALGGAAVGGLFGLSHPYC